MKRAALTLFVLLTSCLNSVDTPEGGIGGTYALVTVDASPVPFRTASGFTVRGTMQLNGDGKYTLTQADSASAGAVTGTSLAGTWRVSDNAITLAGDSKQPFLLGLAVFDSIKLDFNSHTNMYVKR